MTSPSPSPSPTPPVPSVAPVELCGPHGCYMCTTPHVPYWATMNASWSACRYSARLTDEEIEIDRGRPHP